MNPRRVHDLLRQNFPDYFRLDLDWRNIADRTGSIDVEVLAQYLDRYIDADDVLVEAGRKTGAYLSKAEVAAYVATHSRQGVRMTDRKFDGFVVLGGNGVIAGWRRASPPADLALPPPRKRAHESE
ncbi:hypothetical protein [Jeongeupia chitinilytica]|uniref:DUF4440 domain-containing protein n=1 Tax=Jeongeupia chitinilytica TaxID=1041641 RepID=A0ABQ3GV84_9NEIS|nr:hypothetical protein [Jeongeupia chitinilytica]GHD56571.1 hypothetical protein GCM10007350_03970 [Jeongeupia chitinilytica]